MCDTNEITIRQTLRGLLVSSIAFIFGISALVLGVYAFFDNEKGIAIAAIISALSVLIFLFALVWDTKSELYNGLQKIKTSFFKQK